MDPVREHHIVMNDEVIRRFREDGYAVLAGAFDAAALAGEIGAVFVDAFDPEPLLAGAGGIHFASVPMMTERTPASTSLADALADVAASALGRAVLPGRAKGTKYVGESAWHHDSDQDVPSAGIVAYLEPLEPGRGAFEVVPGSHRSRHVAPRRDPVALATRPGDLVVFDEHLTHGSRGGTLRRQWRVDYIADPRSEREEALVRRSFAQIFDTTWDGGYDPDLYPSYGAWWQRTHPEWSARLGALGVLQLARAQEAAMRDRRLPHPGPGSERHGASEGGGRGRLQLGWPDRRGEAPDVA